MQGNEIRQAFLEYFQKKNHEIVASSSLVPANDPTLLFSNAGMNQFKDCFLGGEKRSYTRATSSQKCLRISGKHNDLENVGVTARHHTFFEMLGNFSFGDYFKTDAIQYAWEFCTEVLKLPKSHLWVTVFEEDDEAKDLWAKHTDIDPKRIVKMGEKDNFWAMGDTGPCGPCSEIFYYLGDSPEKQCVEEFLNDDGTYVEIWNLVFMQFDRQPDGTLNPLPKPSVDTGSGLERVSAVMQGKKSNYDCDLLRGIIAVTEKISGFKYDGSSYAERDLKSDINYARDVAMRVIADHSRAIAFLVADGVLPSSDGRGYVLRRLLRRAVRHGKVLGFKEPFLAKTTAKAIELMGPHYAELIEHKDFISRIVTAEEVKFFETLDSGLAILNKEVSKLKSGETFPGKVAFMLHDTYGFPLDLTEDALKADNIKVDVDGFEKAMAEQKNRSREDRKSQNLSFVGTNLNAEKTEFLGYQTTSSESKILQVIFENPEITKAKKGDAVSLMFNATPFYAESGGQVGDTGTIKIGDTTLQVIDTQKFQGAYFVHTCNISEGAVSSSMSGDSATLEVDLNRRRRIMANHSATHLVHSGLRHVLGTHVKQAGSRVDHNTLRFDYSHFEPITESQLRDIQSFVNHEVRSNYEVVCQTMSVGEAKKKGAMALFGEKYGDVVRVIEIGPNSLELCGGTHVTRSGDIGIMLIGSESGISSGVRRIECFAGESAHDQLLMEREEKLQIANLLKSGYANVGEKVEKLVSKTRLLEKELETTKTKLASISSDDLTNTIKLSPSGLKIIAEKVENADIDTLKGMVDKMRVKIGTGVVALGSTQGDSSLLVAGATANLSDKVHVGNVVKEAIKESGGRGGGRADFAQAGGIEPANLTSTLDKFFTLVK